VIETIQPRQLWLLGGSDRQAPNAATQAILRQVQQKRRHIAVVVFPKADHGLIEPVTIPSTTATATGTPMAYSAKLFDLTAGWIKHNTLPAPGRFVTMPVAP
jgi:dienelactone hydrolase